MARRKWKQPKKTSSLWTDFQQVYPAREDGTRVDLERGETYWRNSFYLVFRKELEPDIGLQGSVLLRIRHNQDKAVRDWKHLQRIKNELAGSEREATEIFPPQSMLTSMDNEHHLFVTPVGVSSIYVYEEKVRAEGLSGYGLIRQQQRQSQEGRRDESDD